MVGEPWISRLSSTRSVADIALWWSTYLPSDALVRWLGRSNIGHRGDTERRGGRLHGACRNAFASSAAGVPSASPVTKGGVEAHLSIAVRQHVLECRSRAARQPARIEA